MDGTIVFNQTFQASIMANVTVWSNIPTTAPDRQALADALRGSWSTLFAGNQSGGWSLDSVTFVYNETLPIYSVVVPFTAGILVGTSTGSAYASQVSLVVSTQQVGSPPNRGRVYLTGFTEFELDAGTFTVAAADDAQALVESWADGVNYGSNTAFLRIARRNPDGTLAVTNGIETVVARTRPGVQRRRRRGQGS